jgi:hypothetical protein
MSAGNNEGIQVILSTMLSILIQSQIIKLRNLFILSSTTQTKRPISGRRTSPRGTYMSVSYPILRVGCLIYITIAAPLTRAMIMISSEIIPNNLCSGYGKVTTDRTVGCVFQVTNYFSKPLTCNIHSDIHQCKPDLHLVPMTLTDCKRRIRECMARKLDIVHRTNHC